MNRAIALLRVQGPNTMAMSSVTWAVLVWGSAWALYRIAFPRGIRRERTVSELRRLLHQVIGMILVPIVALLFLVDGGYSTQTNIVGMVVAFAFCISLYGFERWNRNRELLA